MRSKTTIAIGLFFLATSTLQISLSTNFCYYGMCVECEAGGKDLGKRSCSKCKKGTKTYRETEKVSECVDDVTLPNCKMATTENTRDIFCSECNPDYVNINQVCTAVTTKIPNCLFYDTLTTCSMCHGGHFLDAAKTTCTKVTTEIPNCDIY